MAAIIVGLWILSIAVAALISLVSFFVIGPHFPDRGATPIAGARVPFFSAEHSRQLREYKAICERDGRSLAWWAIVFYSVHVWPWLIGLAVATMFWFFR